MTTSYRFAFGIAGLPFADGGGNIAFGEASMTIHILERVT
jgi:hypothetical protein